MLTNFARENKLDDARIRAIGAFSGTTLGFFDPARKEYEEISVDEQVKVLSLLGVIALKHNGEPQVHVHVVLVRSDSSTRGGPHLLEARVGPTLEVVAARTPDICGAWDEQVGLALSDCEVRVAFSEYGGQRLTREATFCTRTLRCLPFSSSC